MTDLPERVKVLIGIDYPVGQRAEAGDVILTADLPESSLDWLFKDGVIVAHTDEGEEEAK